MSDALCESFKAIGAYDFDTKVSVNVLGHIFEQSITDIEELKLEALGAPAPVATKRKREGIYYTPPHITRFIVEEAVGGWLESKKEAIGFSKLTPLEDDDYASIVVPKAGKYAGKIRFNKNVAAHIRAWEEYDKALRGIKVLDPACGPGAFLNEVFDYLFRKGQAVNSQLSILRGDQMHLFRWDAHILRENLHGVDLNPDSVELTKLSLWLKTANRSEKLTYLDDNIKCGNSLVEPSEGLAGGGFAWAQEFPDIASRGGFDVVVGNPPYVLSRDNLLDELKEYAQLHYKLYSDKINLYLLFIERSLDLVTQGGFLSFIVPNSFLGIESAVKRRRWLVEETQLHSVVNLLGSTFSGANVEAAVFCAKKSAPENHNVAVGTVARTQDLEGAFLKVPQLDWLSTPGSVWDVKSDEPERKLLDKLSALTKLSDFYDAKAGLQAYERGKGNPSQTASDVASHLLDYSHKFDDATFKYLKGGTHRLRVPEDRHRCLR